MSNQLEEKLPPGWGFANFGDIAMVVRGVTYGADQATKDPDEGMVPLLRAGNISDSIQIADLVFVPTECVGSDQWLKSGDILVVASSGSKSSVGRSALLSSPWRGTFGAFCFVLRPHPNFNARFLALFLRTESHRRLVAGLSAGISINNLRKRHLESQSLPVPPAPEQHRIVAELEKHLTRLDATVAALKRAQANLKRYRAAVLKAACEGRLVPTEAELARAEAWSWTTLGEIADVSGGITKNPRRASHSIKVPYLRVANVYAGELRLGAVEEIGVTEGELQRVLLQKADLLVVEGNGSREQIGRVALWDGSIQRCAHQNHLIKVRFKDPAVAEFVLLWFLSRVGRDQILEVASSTSGLYTLSLSKVSALAVALPPLEDQQRIVAEVERLFSVIIELEKTVHSSLQRAERLRQAILKKAFEGKLVPQDPDDEPATALLERIRQEREATQTGKKTPKTRRR